MVTWVIEDGTFHENQTGLIEAIQKAGYDYKLTSKDSYMGLYPRNPVIFYGSLALSQRIRRDKDWIGNWSDLKQFKCSSYYGKYGGKLLNSEYVMVPAGDFERWRKEVLPLTLNEEVGYDRYRFIRPDSAFKTFSGDVIRPEQTLKQFLVNSVLFDDEMILLARPQRIHREWRFIICEGKVASYSLYMRDGEPDNESPNICPQSFQDFVQTCLAWSPEPCYTLDICEDEEGNPKIVEINSFSCSGFYRADLNRVVEMASEVAIKEYEEIL